MVAAVQEISRFGWLVYDSVTEFGKFIKFVWDVLVRFTANPMRCLKWTLLGPQFYSVGVASIPVVAITGAFIGMILALEGFEQFAAFGQESRLGSVINLSVTKQIGPVLAAVMVAGRVGGALAAELGTMAVTEQLDAMRAMDADPLRILVAPRVVACIIMTPLLTIYSDLLGAWGAWFVTVRIYDVSSENYWFFTAQALDWWDPTSGLLKSVAFGAAIGFISCFKGFTCSAGAAGVGRAATNAFVASFLAIVIINLVLAQFFGTIYELVTGRGSGLLP
ncbi:MAG: ABC transporter permease [Planctomycetota bacterium]|nr:ABC transporter permease [Planctomycetota bacterium]